MRWWIRQLGRYWWACAAGWVLGGLVTSDGLFLTPITVFGFMFFYGPIFGIPTAAVLAVLYHVGRRWPATFRFTATVLLPLVAILIPVDAPPSVTYGLQLFVQVPIQVAFAWLVQPPEPKRNPAPGMAAKPGPGPDRAWYTLPVTVTVWLVLLLWLGHPWLSEWLPLGPQRAAHAVVGPAYTVRITPGDDRYLLYEDDSDPDSQTCRASLNRERPGNWIWDRPAGSVTHEGRVYRYRGVVAGPGEFSLSCDDTLFLVDRYEVGAAPMRAAVAGGAVLPILGIVYIAWARRRARVTTDAGG